MKIAIIAAMGENRAIGLRGKIPWHLATDFKRFKELTMGHPIIEGRKTYESIGKPLPGRTNIVITSNRDFKAPGCLIAGSLEEALRLADNRIAAENGDIVFICGGEQVYRAALPHANVIYLTVVQGSFEGDAFFPEIPAGQWELVDSQFHEKDDANPVAFTWLTYERKHGEGAH